MRLPVSPKGVADLFDNIVISLNRWEGGRGFVGIAIYRNCSTYDGILEFDRSKIRETGGFLMIDSGN